MPLVSGGGGALPSQWTVAAGGQLEIDATDTSDRVLALFPFPGATQDTLFARSSASSTNVLELFAKGGLYLACDDAAQTGLFVQPVATPNAGVHLAQFQNPAGTQEVRVSRNAYLMFNAHAAPADADLSAGDCALWFDQTNGAAKLMVKAKQADGTVKTASVALA